MNRLNYILASASVALALQFSAPSLNAQQERPGRGDFDPGQFRERMMERVREQLEVKNDDEWKVIESRVSRVMEARRETMGGRGFGGPPRRGGGDERGRGRGGFRGESAPEVASLESALESNASAEDIKAKLAAVRKARQDKEAQLQKAQEDLKKVLSIRQEANAVILGLIE